MSDANLLKRLMGLQGKILLWSGFDAETDAYVLIFEDKMALSLSEGNLEFIDDITIWAESTLQEQGTHAKQILKLQDLLHDPDKEKKGE